MKQLVQKLNDGRPFVLDAPEPILQPGFVLVRNRYSVVSAGTEGATVRSARKSLVGKALERPKEVKAVLDLFRRQGAVQTYRAVMKKLDAYSPLGYSSSGIAIAVGEGVTSITAGDRVACAGVGYANHAEIVAVPENLCVKLERDADLKAAAYNTLGAIAMQGVRQADLRLGESCAVIGLGLVGTLVMELLKASGVQVFGIDVAQSAVERAKRLGFSDAKRRDDPALEENILLKTRGLGVDAVIIAAGSSSLDPIDFAGRIARQKGRVVVLGDVPTGFARNPEYYPKELEVRMSCSYGPGRYDLNYEEKGCDYPPSYVRWTENRNMQAFQALVHSGAVDCNALTSHVFSLDDAPKAYDMLLGKTEPYLGVLLEYDAKEEAKPYAAKVCASDGVQVKRDSVGYAFIGAGSYAQGSLLPNLPRDAKFTAVGVAARSGSTSRRVAEKFGFQRAESDPKRLIESPDVDAVFITTRHDSHAEYALDALRAGKNVFVEKPLCLTLDEFVEIRAEYERLAQKGAPPRLMVGFNRRFAPSAQTLKKALGDAPMSIIYRVNAGAIPGKHWIQDPTIGGGRVLGEACHFVDFCTWLSGSTPISVYAAKMEDGTGLNDTLSVALRYEDGSIANVCYFANGAKSVAKERVEVFQGGQTAILDDFRAVHVFGAKTTSRKGIQDKGQAAELSAFLGSIRDGAPCPIPVDEIFGSTLATFAILESLRSHCEIPLA